ncbi:MAG: patatin-like phospholipase family protein [Acidimicrobiales bacterium]|nr:patatin-like phospholipase family protein [Acidimicrobiales bacterium]
MTTVGLILGAGGLHAAAQHAGVLAALAEATAWDPRTSDVVVGTSAGATTAASLRAGLSAGDHRAHYVGDTLSASGQALVDRVTTRLDMDLPLDRSGRRLPAKPMLVLRELLSTGRPRPVVSLAGLLPVGSHDGSPLGARTREIHPGRWPGQPTWICALDLDSGKRVVLGRDDIDADLGSAVQASTAVPGWFAPVEIDGRRLVDGGVHSTTNADLVATLGLDLVVVSSSKTVGGTIGSGVGLASAWHGRSLRREVEAIRRNGTTVLVLQPTVTELAGRSGNDRSDERLPEVCEAARVSALARLSHPDAATARRLLDSVTT